MNSASQNPFELLKTLDQRVLTSALPLSERPDKDNSWQAIAFMLDDRAMLINMSDVAEVSPQPPVTRLPGVQRWVKGIANVRGEVLTIVDLHEFFHLETPRNPALSRVIAIERGEKRLGVLVDRIVGMRQISSQKISSTPSDGCPEKIKNCITGAVQFDENWMDIFDTEKLVTHEQFLNVSTL